MNYFKTHCIYLLLFAAYHVTTYSQTNVVYKIAAPPTANNFTYPQSVFVDSHSGHVWVTDFSNNRVLRFDISTLTAINESHTSSSPSDYFLGQNYPNPFNSSTQIMFSNNSSGIVLLEVYNLLGQKVFTLFNQVTTANTMYSITFDAKNLPSGIYLYSLHTVNGIEVKKMCLLK
jgi:hypothetical protein